MIERVKTEEILSELEARGKEENTQPELLDFYSRLLEIQSEAEKKIGIPEISSTRKESDRRLAQGLPLLRFEELNLDWTYLKGVFTRIEALFGEYAALFSKPIAREGKADYTTPWLKKAVRAWFEGYELPVEPGSSQDEAKYVLGDILQSTLKPFLAAYRNALLPSVNQDSWRRLICPVCGGKPDFAYLDEEGGARWLVCSRCDADWLFQRLQCPYCGTQNQNDLAYFTDEAGHYRLYVCENCGKYMKALDLRGSKTKFVPSLERFFTFGIDSQAKEYGYIPYSGGEGEESQKNQ